MRERSTWTHEDIAKRAAEKPGDIYTMNQDHPQPAFDAYVTGDPSDFAEDVHSPNEWEKEYKGDEVKRNEIGMAEMRPDTFNHSEKTASRETMLKKADLCVEIATLMLQGRKTASESSIEDQAVALMYLPDQELINTHTRLAADQEADEEGDEGQAQQSKQAQDQSDEDQGQAQAQQSKQAQQFEEDKEESEEQAKQAQDQSEESEEAQAQQAKQAQQQGGKSKKDDQNAKANKNWPSKEANQDVQAQVQQMQAQLQQLMQALQQGQPQQAQQQQAPVAQEQDLDQLLAADDCGPMAEADIQMDPFMDDMGGLGEEDETLRALFANEDEQEEVQQSDEQQAKQASVRTASTRTVGTRPSAGVSKIGGNSKVASSSATDNLSALWQSAPDVRGAFGLK